MTRLRDAAGPIEDEWTRIGLEDPIPEGVKIIAPWERFEGSGAELGASNPSLGLHVAGDAEPEAVARAFNRVALISVEFTSFADGRGFSIARRLRALGYTGRLRAAGPVISDQAADLFACGFDEIEIAEQVARRQDDADWDAAQATMSSGYQRGYARAGASPTDIFEKRRLARKG